MADQTKQRSTIGRTADALGLITSVLALSSLIYGAFQEPLGPYMQGIMGGIMMGYRAIRDVFYEGLGWILALPINWLGEWFIWIPPAPWFAISPFFADLVTLISITLASAISSRGITKAAAENPYTFTPWARFSFTLVYFFAYLVGAGLFFLLAYAEKQIGS